MARASNNEWDDWDPNATAAAPAADPNDEWADFGQPTSSAGDSYASGASSNDWADYGSTSSSSSNDWADYGRIGDSASGSQSSGAVVGGRRLPRLSRPPRGAVEAATVGASAVTGGRRPGWPSAALYVSVVAVFLAGLALFFALDRINVLDPSTIADAGLILLASILLSGLIFACVIAAVVAMVRRYSMWRAVATLATGIFLAPAVLYYAMLQGIDAMRENVGRSALGYVPETATMLRQAALEQGIDLGWVGTLLQAVGG